MIEQKEPKWFGNGNGDRLAHHGRSLDPLPKKNEHTKCLCHHAINNETNATELLRDYFV